MTDIELLEIIGDTRDNYIMEAQKLRAGGRKVRQLRHVRELAAVIVLVLTFTFFLNTEPGATAFEYVKEKVSGLIETLFPPKKMTIIVEGAELEGNYVANGAEPGSGVVTTQPGFAIYYDMDSYIMKKEGNVTYIRPYFKPMTREKIMEEYGDYLALLSEEIREREIVRLMEPQLDQSLPECEMEIIHLDIPYEQASSQERAELEKQWKINEYTGSDRVTFCMHNGVEWNSPIEDRYYISDEQGGCFRIVCRYYGEAAEGVGVRFAAFVGSFTVIPPQ